MKDQDLSKKAPRVVGIGEILWDLLPDRRLLGGAPANFAFHARSLGAEAAIVSRLGEDPSGDEIVAAVKTRGVEHRFLGRDADRPTGSVSVSVDAHGKPRYVIHEDVAWDFIEVGGDVRDHVGEARAVCFGTLAQRGPVSRRAIRELVEAAPADALKVFDVNLRQDFYSREIVETSLALATALKLSDEELPVVTDMFGISGSDDTRRLEELARRFSLDLVALTRGAGGAVLWTHGATSEHPGFAADVRDTVGAGDSFTATMTMGVLRGQPLEQINERANRVAAWVCSRDGAAPPLPDEYAGWFTPAAQG